jgi:hypothetical protein
LIGLFEVPAGQYLISASADTTILRSVAAFMPSGFTPVIDFEIGFMAGGASWCPIRRIYGSQVNNWVTEYYDMRIVIPNGLDWGIWNYSTGGSMNVLISGYNLSP